jgi:N-acetylglucosamine kinase-like BadF-type ATPase
MNVVAVDGGNSKTDLALVRADGEVLALVRGPASSPQHLGAERCLDTLESLLDEAAADRPQIELAELLLAGVDFPAEVEGLERLAASRGWARRIVVDNDTFAILRAGTERGWGVAVTCGAGINCVGVGPDGRHARFPSLGLLSGDWGGGYDVGMAAVSAAARSEDGRGPKTVLEHAVPEHFALETPSALAEAIHFGRIDERRVVELAPIVLAEAADDPVASELRDRLADEVVALARVALQRLDLTVEPVHVVLGGGLLQSGDRGLLAAVESGLRTAAPSVELRVVDAPPIVGAALLALEGIGAPPEALARAQRELGAPTLARTSGG